MKKVVFFDIDGTLLDHGQKVPESTLEALQQLKENGVFVAIATGRAPFMFENIRKKLDIDSFVSFNGQYVVFEHDVIYKNPLSKDGLKRIYETSLRNDHPLVFMNETEMKASVKHHPFIEESLGSIRFPHPEEKVNFFLENEIYQSLLFCDEQNEEQYVKAFPEFHFIRWHRYSVDILPSGGSKAEGIKKMIKKLGFELADVFAFGDGLNDIEMLKAVGTGVAMGNALDEVKAHADLVTKDVGNDGIWHGLKELQLI